MDLGSLFLILALLILVVLFIAQPFLNKKTADEAIQEIDPGEHEKSALLAERDRVLNALQELDFDYALGKIPEEDYPQQRAGLLQHGADILRKLDALESQTPHTDAETRLEAAIAARRADSAEPKSTARKLSAVPATQVALDSTGDDEIETLLANRRRSRQEKAAGFCPKCGGPVQKSDRFCPKCGAKLA